MSVETINPAPHAITIFVADCLTPHQVDDLRVGATSIGIPTLIRQAEHGIVEFWVPKMLVDNSDQYSALEDLWVDVLDADSAVETGIGVHLIGA